MDNEKGITTDVPGICARLSPTMKHVLLRCSEVERWDGTGRTWPRQWPDLCGQRRNTSFQTIRALLNRGLVYADENGDGYGLTPTGIAAWITLRSTAHLLKEQQP